MAAGSDKQETHLLLWRHAEAEPGVPDAARELTGKGRKQAREVGRWLRKRLPKRTRVLVSPAVRAQQTAEALGLSFTTLAEVGLGADSADVLAEAGWPDGGDTVLVVGHQPTLGLAAALALTGRPANWVVKKGAVWWLVHRVRGGREEAWLRAVIAADLA